MLENNKFEMAQTYEIFINTLNSNCNDRFVSMYSLVLDSLGFLTIKNIIAQLDENTMNFFYPFLIKLCALLQYEMIIYWESIDAQFGGYKAPSPEYREFVKQMRKKIHQFESKPHYKHRKQALHKTMGTSADICNPMVDFSIFNSEDNKKLLGTSHSYFDVYICNSEAENNQILSGGINLFDQNLKLFNLDLVEITSKIYFDKEFKITQVPYSFITAINDFGINDQRLLDRNIEIFNDLGYIVALFYYIADFNHVNDFLVFPLTKFLSIAFDESVDNLTRYIEHSQKDESYNAVFAIKSSISTRAIKYAKTMRNNIHYNEQRVDFDLSEIKIIFNILVSECIKLHDLIGKHLNFNLNSFSAEICKYVYFLEHRYNEK